MASTDSDSRTRGTLSHGRRETPSDPTTGSDAGDGLQPILLGREHAADFLNIGRRLAWELANRRILKTVRIGRRVLYPVDHLHEWVARGCPEKPEWWKAGRS